MRCVLHGTVVLVILFAIAAHGGEAKPGKGSSEDLFIVPIDVSCLTPPIAFKAGGRWNLAYELRIASQADKGDITIASMDVLDGNHKALVRESGKSLEVAGYSAEALTLKPRTYTTVFMWISASSFEEIPAVLRHTITVKSSDGTQSTDTPAIEVDRRSVLIIDPPLRGDHWVAANGPSNNSAHRRAILPLDGRSYIGQKYAIDWAQTSADGPLYHGDKLDNRSYRGYGQPIYAVADGTITETKDGIPENVPDLTARAVTITLDTVAGNHVIEKIGDRAYATYAHLQPGSLKVKVGEQVKRGQVLGLVGNSGNSTAPHLHFQLCDANSVLECNGIPYAFSSFEWVPKENNKPGTPQKRENEMPMEDDVVNFPQP